MSWPRVVEWLQAGTPVTLHPKGNSMTPRIKSGDEVVIVPLLRDGCVRLREGDVVLAKVKGRYYLHIAKTIRYDVDPVKVLIANNHGHENGWTTIDKVYGVAL